MLGEDYDDGDDFDGDQDLSPFERTHKQIHVRGAMDGVNRYNPDNLKTFLEDYVRHQVEEGQYDLPVNLSILKLYQLNPDNFNQDTVARILVLAMVQMPKADFALAKCLLDMARMDEPEIADILSLAADYEQCRFEVVWETISRNPEITRGVGRFAVYLREYVCYVVNLTYQNIKKDILVRLLGNVSDAELAAIAAKNEWKIERDFVHITNMEDTVKSKNIAEKIDFKSVEDVLKLSLHG